MARKSDFTIKGVIRDAKTHLPLQGLRIKAFDADLLTADDALGEGKTGVDGRFTIHYGRPAFVKGLLERIFEGGADLVLQVYDAENNLLHTLREGHGAERRERFGIEIMLPPAPAVPERVTGSSPAARLLADDDEAAALERVGVRTVSDLRVMDVRGLAGDVALERVGLDAGRLESLKASAFLAAVAPEPEVRRALEAAGIRDVSRLARTPVSQVRAAVDAVFAGGDAKLARPAATAVTTAYHRANQLLDRMVTARLGDIGFTRAECVECADGCCGSPDHLSILSKAAYLSYLVNVFGADVGELTEHFRQDFSAPGCAEVPLVRLTAEVLERALLEGDFPSVSRATVLRYLVADRVVVRQALLSRVGRLDPDRIVALGGEFGGNPLQGVSLGSETQLRGAVDAIDAGNRDLADRLLAETQLGREIVESAWLQASGDDLEAAHRVLSASGNFTAELMSLGRSLPPRPVPDLAVRHRAKLISLTGMSASALHERYHVNFLATEGRIARCDQAILTLQEAMRCDETWYLYCCTRTRVPLEDRVETAEGTGTRFREYEEYRLWIETILYPETFYDLHVKTPLVRGDVGALRKQLDQAEDALEAVTSSDEELKTLMGLFSQGFQVIRELLDIDELIADGHIAHRDEEYGLALARYQQAAERIRRHVKRFHSARLATYDELFYGTRVGCEDQEPRVFTAAELLEALQTASLQSGLTRRLISPATLGPIESASGWWPSDGLFPTMEDLRQAWEDAQDDPRLALALLGAFLTGGVVGLAGTFLALSKFVRKEGDLDALRDTYPTVGLDVMDTPDGRRFSLPFILQDEMMDNATLQAELQTALNELLVTLAFAKIEGRLGNLASELTVDASALESCLTGVWGTANITLDPAGLLTVAGNVARSVGCILNFADDVAGSFDEAILGGLIDGCKATQSIPVRDPFTGTVIGSINIEYIDAACVVTTIVASVTAAAAPPVIDLTSPETLLASLDTLGGSALQAVSDGIADWLGDDWRPDNLEDLSATDRAALGLFANRVVHAFLDTIVVEDRSAWIARDGALQEVSNLYDDGDVRSRAKHRRGSILYDRNALGDAAFGSYSARFKLNTEDNDDLGIAFRMSEENEGHAYYLLAMRNGDGEEAQHDLQKRGMQAGWSFLIASGLQTAVAAAVSTSGMGLVPGIVILGGVATAVPAAFLVWLAGLAALEFAWEDVFPPDTARDFIRLIKVRPGQAPQVLWPPEGGAAGAKIRQRQDYDVHLQVTEREGEPLQIRIELGEPEAEPIVTISLSDSDPIGPGGVGLHVSGNSKAIFKQADITYFPAGTGNLGRLLFVPVVPEGEELLVDPHPYLCRMTSPSDRPERLDDWVTVDAGEQRVVIVRGPGSTDEGENALTVPQDDEVDLSPYQIGESRSLRYGLFDPWVDRLALARLVNGLSGLLPHQYFYLLPLSIADALHGAGDHEGAKKHYDLIYDLFPNEVERREEWIDPIAAVHQESSSYADGPERRVGYSFLHVDLPTSQIGIEERQMRARHAANHLAAGEAAFVRNDPESRRRAYEELSKVLLAHDRTRCCTGWEGEVLCVPGAGADAIPPGEEEPDDTGGGNGGRPADDLDLEVPAGLEECGDRFLHVKKLIRSIAAHDEARAEQVVQFLRRLLQSRKADCSTLDQLIAATEVVLRRIRAELVGTRDGRVKLPLVEHAYVQVVDDFELVGDAGMAALRGRMALARTGVLRSVEGGDQRAAALPAGPSGGAAGVGTDGHRHGGAAPEARTLGNGAPTGTAVALAGHGGHAHSFPGMIKKHPVGSIVFLDNETPGCSHPPDDCLTREEKRVLIDLAGVYRCVPRNPLTEAQVARACLHLQSLDDGLNVLGLREDQITGFRYEYLLALARGFANFAVAAERDFLQFREKLSASRLSVMQQEHGLALLGQQMRVRQLTGEQAAVQVRISGYQVGMGETRDSHLDTLLQLNDVQMALAAMSALAGISQGVLGLVGAGVGLVGAGAGVVAAIPTGGASLIASVAGLGVAGISLVGAGGGIAGGLMGGIQGMFSVYQQRVMLEQQQALLRNFELPMARLGEQNAVLAERIARRQLEIGLLEIAHAQRVLTYLSHQFLNADMYSFLARQSKRNYQQYLAYATRAALMAERALEAERGLEFNIVKLDYFDVSQQGLLGGEALQKDLETLEFQRFVQDEFRQHPPLKVFSLANAFPVEFEHFRHTGQLWFRTDHLDFDRDFPGHYHRRIRSVRVMVFALAGEEGVKATLSQLGPSEIVVREGDRFRIRPLPGAMRSVALAGAPDGRGIVPLNPLVERLNPFEGSGVAATWLLEMPKYANRMDYSTVVDVQFIVEYTSYSDEAYRREVEDALRARGWVGSRVLRLRFNYPDAYYHLLNPSPAGPEITTSLPANLQTVSVATTAREYPHNEEKRRLLRVSLSLFDGTGRTLEASEVKVAARRHVEALWRAGAAEKELPALDLVAQPGKTRVLRGGEPVIVDETAARPGETKHAGKWVRVLRGRKLAWVPDGQALPTDQLLSAVNPATTPLPEPVPVELLRKAQVPMPRRDGTDPYTGVSKRLFDLRVRDDGTPPVPGQKRVLRGGELEWVDSLAAGESELAAGVWVRVLDGGTLQWKQDGAENPPGSFGPVDTWYLSMDPAANPALAAGREVGGFPVLDLNEASEVLLLMGYDYRLPAATP